MVELQKIATEQRNPNTTHIDTLSTLEMVRLINQEDQKVALAVAQVAPEIARAIDVITRQLSQGGRLFYAGCGTSGRLGILDAVECPPTYSTDPELVQAIIAGGYPAIFRAVEGAEEYGNPCVPRCRYERSGDGGGAPGKSCLMIFNTYVPRRTPPLFRAFWRRMRAHTRACARMPACGRALINNIFFRAHNTVERKIYPPL